MNPILARLFARRNISLCVIKKGYRALKKEGELDRLTRLESILARTRIDDVSIPFATDLFAEYRINAELSIRQFLVTEILGSSFKASILYSVGSSQPMAHPLPKAWRRSLLEQGTPLNGFMCGLLWNMYSLKYLVRGIVHGLKSIFHVQRKSNLKSYAYFDRLSNNLNGESVSSRPDVKNIVNWYIQWKKRNQDIDTICHSVDTDPNFTLQGLQVVRTDGLPYLHGIKFLHYVFFVMYTSIFSLLFFLFRPYCGFLYKEVVQSERVELSDQELLAKEYLFNNSRLYYRPIWTYIAESKGARVLFYFYSSNNTIFATSEECPTQNPWFLMTWSHYLVWDKYQTGFLQRMGQDQVEIEEVGPIWFLSSERSLKVSSNAVAIFDVTPMRPAISMAYGLSEDYYSYQTVKRFLDDIRIVLKSNDLIMVHKAKRINTATDRRYRVQMKQLSEDSHYHAAHPSIDIYKAIDATKASISLPFTSPAVAAKLVNKPSIYYDPTGEIQKNNAASHGVEVLTNIDELQDWVLSLKGV